MAPPRDVRRGQAVVDFHDGLLHRDLLDDRAGEVKVLSSEHEDRLLGNVLVGETVLQEEVADVGHHAQAERLLARHERERAREVLHHEMRRRAHLGLVALHGEILHREFTSRDAGDRDRAFDDGRDDLADRTVDRDAREATE